MPLLRTVGRTAVIAGTASAVSGRVQRRQQQRWDERSQAEAYQQQQQAAPPPPPPAAPASAAAPSMEDKVEQLKQLAQLKDQGILTEEEFAAQKAKILG
jgi:hypothetical protein